MSICPSSTRLSPRWSVSSSSGLLPAFRAGLPVNKACTGTQEIQPGSPAGILHPVLARGASPASSVNILLWFCPVTSAAGSPKILLLRFIVTESLSLAKLSTTAPIPAPRTLPARIVLPMLITEFTLVKNNPPPAPLS